MKLAIGTAQLGLRYGLFKKKMKLNEIRKIKNFLLKSKIDFIDTAISYGSSEKLIGKNFSNQFKIITKIKISPSKEKLKDQVLKKIQTSLKNLKTKQIYGLLIHDYKDLYGRRGKYYLKLLKDLKKKKIIKKLGISIYDPQELNRIYKFFKPDIVQAPLSVFDQRLKNSGWLDKLNKSKVEIQVRSCFLQGLLINYINNSKIKRTFKSYQNILDQWFSWCQINKISPLMACLSFVKQQKKVDYIVVGFDSLSQLKKIVLNFNKKSKLIPYKFNNDNLDLIDPRNWNKL